MSPICATPLLESYMKLFTYIEFEYIKVTLYNNENFKFNGVIDD